MADDVTLSTLPFELELCEKAMTSFSRTATDKRWHKRKHFGRGWWEGDPGGHLAASAILLGDGHTG